ncbi:MAG: hypothetical protein J2P19_03765 [Pseudonocardia sp.]|nr:hypothetical protein [Pseudonocardia sp.]
MIIWRGWGIVALLPVLGIPIIALPIGLGLGLPDRAVPLVIGLVLAAGSVGTWFLARHLNVTLPERRLGEWATQRRTELDQYVRAGTFNLGPGHPAPGSYSEAEQQATALLEAEQRQLAARLPNRHTLFFIPAQYVVIGIGVLGLVLVVVGLVGLLSG